MKIRMKIKRHMYAVIASVISYLLPSAEGAGFEPARAFLGLQRFSRPPPLTTRPPLQGKTRYAVLAYAIFLEPFSYRPSINNLIYLFQLLFGQFWIMVFW